MTWLGGGINGLALNLVGVMKRAWTWLALALAPGLVIASVLETPSVEASSPKWSSEELATLRSLSIASLEPIASDPSNKYADDARAVQLGHKLFFDTRLSSNGKVACATCHVPEKQFQDGTALGVGIGTTNRRTMTVVGTAHSPW